MSVKTIRVTKHPLPQPVARLVQGDANTQVLRFAVKKEYGGHDLSDLVWSVWVQGYDGEAEVSYIGAGTVSGDDIILDWNVIAAATKSPGFTVIKLYGSNDGDGDTEYAWVSGNMIINVSQTQLIDPGYDSDEVAAVRQLVTEFGNRVNTIKTYQDKTFVSPEMYGAKGDGVTDDTKAIQDAIKYAINDRDYALPVIGRGRYKTTEPIIIKGNRSETCGKPFIVDLENVYADIPAAKRGAAIVLKDKIQGAKLRIGTLSSNYECLTMDTDSYCDYSDITGDMWTSRNATRVADYATTAEADRIYCIKIVTDASVTNFFNANRFCIRRVNSGEIYLNRCHDITFDHVGFEYGRLRANECYNLTMYSPHLSDPGDGYIIKTENYCSNFTVIGGSGAQIGNDLLTDTDQGACVFSGGTCGTIIMRCDRTGTVSERTMFSIIYGRVVGINQNLSATTTPNAKLNSSSASNDMYDTRLVMGAKLPKVFVCDATATTICLDAGIYGSTVSDACINDIIIMPYGENTEAKWINIYRGWGGASTAGSWLYGFSNNDGTKKAVRLTWTGSAWIKSKIDVIS